MASLEEIGQLGHPEKHAAREYAAQEAGKSSRGGVRFPQPMADLIEGRERMAFLQGILWERAHVAELEAVKAHMALARAERQSAAVAQIRHVMALASQRTQLNGGQWAAHHEDYAPLLEVALLLLGEM
jgi:hypothetical protein